MKRIDDLVEADKIEAAKPRLPKGTGTLLMDKFGLKGKELGEIMDFLKEEVESGSVDPEFDFVVAAVQRKLNA